MEDVLQGKYRILHEIGQGGMAVVYKGLDTQLEREVAVKVLHPHLAGRADSRIRLQREAKAVAKLHHPNILEIYDYSGPDSERCYIVTEYIRGETLKDFTDRHTPSLPEVGAMIVHEVAGALAHAHEAGIIHRDIKPENIMIRDDGALKLMDFGIAQIIDMQAMTVTGALVGSPAHMSPEHVEGRPLDFRADVFSLGTLLYFLCAGRLPFDSPSPHALLRQILEARYEDPRLHNPAIGRRLYRIIARCLERDPASRFETVGDLQQELASYLADLGLDDPPAELSDYFEDPPAAEAALTQRVVDRLMRLADSRASSGKVAAALEAYNQVLSLQGDREDALAQVQRLSSSRNRRNRLRWLAGGVAVAASVAVAGYYVGGPQPEAPLPKLNRHAALVPPAAADPAPAELVPAPAEPREAEPEVTVPIEAPAPAPEPMVVRVVREGEPDFAESERRPLVAEATAPPPPRSARRYLPSSRRPAIRPAGSQTKPTATGITFRIMTRQAADIVFRGKVYKNGNTGALTVQPGVYEVTIRQDDCTFCLPRTWPLRIEHGMKADKFRLDTAYKDATLTIDGPAGAAYDVAGHTAKIGQSIDIDMHARDKLVLVKLLVDGKVVAQSHLTLQSGKSHRVRIDPPTN